ncbi:MAG: hypothetical protein R3F62_16385 [Planctomycetota bacterium]
MSERRDTVWALALGVGGVLTLAAVPSAYRALSYGLGSRAITAEVLDCEQSGRTHRAQVSYRSADGESVTTWVETPSDHPTHGAPGTTLELLEQTHWPGSVCDRETLRIDVILAWVGLACCGVAALGAWGLRLGRRDPTPDEPDAT